MKNTLSRLFEMEHLSRAEAYELMSSIGRGEHNEAQLASLLTVWMMRPVVLDELRGCMDALVELSVPFDPEAEVIDLCGTGGDGKNTFNISTLTSFVVAAAGYKVAKHGNYGVSSVSGSSTVMEHFGYPFTNEQDTLKRQLDTCNICFLHAPLFHPALKHVGNVRRQLGMRTIFNMLGPLVNPARPTYRLTGVFGLELGRLYNYLLQEDPGLRYTIVHSLDGYDEISLTGRVKLYTPAGETVCTPEELQFTTIAEADLYGGSTKAAAAAVFLSILEGKGTEAQNSVVCANAAAALRTIEPGISLGDANSTARETLLSGKALETFKKLLG